MQACMQVAQLVAARLLPPLPLAGMLLASAASFSDRADADEARARYLRTAAVLLAGLGAGAAAAVVSQPADVLLTRICGSSAVPQLTECLLDTSPAGMARFLWSLGPKECFAGLPPRLAMISAMTSVQVSSRDGGVT